MTDSLSIIQLAAIVAGYALAVSRLMDAARPLWNWAPPWLQVALPAIVTALPDFAAALGLVKTPVDFAQTIVIALGTILTAMRGALPPKVFERLPLEAKQDLKRARKPKSPKPPSSLLIAVSILLTGCGLFGGAASPEDPPCDEASYAKLSVSCGNDEAECNKQIDEREAFCAKRIKEDSE